MRRSTGPAILPSHPVSPRPRSYQPSTFRSFSRPSACTIVASPWCWNRPSMNHRSPRLNFPRAHTRTHVWSSAKFSSVESGTAVSTASSGRTIPPTSRSWANAAPARRAARSTARCYRRAAGDASLTRLPRESSVWFLLFGVVSAFAVDWQKPPRAVLDVLLAPEIPSAQPSPDGAWLMLLTPVRYPPLSQRAAPMHPVAGIRIDPVTNGFFARTGSVAPTVVSVEDGSTRPLALP